MTQPKYVIATPKVNTEIWMTDDLVVHCFRKRPFNAVQRWFIKVFFGWRVESECNSTRH